MIDMERGIPIQFIASFGVFIVVWVAVAIVSYRHGWGRGFDAGRKIRNAHEHNSKETDMATTLERWVKLAEEFRAFAEKNSSEEMVEVNPHKILRLLDYVAYLEENAPKPPPQDGEPQSGRVFLHKETGFESVQAG
jgi:hypothetical protein